MSFETEKESLSERRHQLRIDAREGARAAAVRQGCVPEGPHRPHEARALYPGGRARAEPREVAARRAGVLSVAWGYRGILPDKKKPRETPSALGSPPDGNHLLHIIARVGVRTRANRSGCKRSLSQLHDLWESRLRLLIKDLRFCKLHASRLHWRLSYYRFKAKGSSLDYLQARPLSSSSPISVLPCGKRR